MAFTLATRLLVLAALLAVPFVWGTFTAYQLALFLLYGIAGQGIALCWGRAGFLPLGQALFFGIGAYLGGWALKSAGDSWLALLPLLACACLVPALLAGLIGVLVFNRQIGSGPYFSLITLALSMLGFQLANSLDWITGGFNGLSGIPGLPGVDSYDGLYFVIVPVLAMTTLALSYVLRAPFGQLLAAIAQNEERLQFLGFWTSGFKALAFAISAAAAGLAGALFAAHQGIVTPQAVGFLLSAELVIWTAVGGRASLAGPVVGAVVIGFLASELRDSFRYWEVVVAIVFIVVVLRFPQGIVGLLGAVASRLGLPGRRMAAPARDIVVVPLDHGDGADLAFRGVHVRMNGVRILNGLDLAISASGIHCIIGPNGAGKTSAFNVLTGRLPATEGEIAWRGRPVTGRKSFEMARLGIGRKFQVPSVFPDLTVGQNVDIALWANRLSYRDLFSMRPYRWRSRVLDRLEIMFPFLAEPSRLTSELSLGQRQMLEFAMTNLSEPRLMLLDEPCAGLSSQETAHMIEAIAALAAEFGNTILIIEHDMQVVERLSNHVYVLHLGARLAEGTMLEIKANEAVRAIYSGGTK
jgi:branched-chain amino acid transport system permease protein